MNRINTAGLELFYRLHFATLKHANTVETAKYAKYAKYAKKIRMQRNTKYKMLFNHGKNPEYTEGMQRQIRINCISSCSSSLSCPKNLESPEL